MNADREHAESRFVCFTFLFAAASIVYHAEHTPWFDLAPGLVPLLAAFAVALRPSSVVRFAFLVAAQSLHAFLGLPLINTNRTVQLIAGVTILAALLLEIARHPFRLPSGGPWLRAFEAPVRLEVLILYAFAFWHKLNWDYLAPETSCAVALYRDLAHWPWLSFLPVGGWTDSAAILGALALEALLPVLLCIGRFRTAAFVGGVAFHAILGAARYFTFSATMTALLLLFAPPRLTASLAARIGGAISPPLRWVAAGALIALSLAGPWDRWPLFYWTWLLWMGALLALIAVGLRSGQGKEPAPPLFPAAHPMLLCLPVLALVNGASPYLGLKTEYSFAMYSNLRTETEPTNHLILVRKLALAGYQEDLVRVLNSSDDRIARLALDARPVPAIWLRRLLWEQIRSGGGTIALTLEREGVMQRVEDAAAHPELGPPTFLERKFLRFRAILPRERNVCAH